MSIFFQEPYAQIIKGDCRVELAQLPAESVQMCVCSPPYWGLRKYSGDQDLIWGGEEDCNHIWGERLTAVQSGGTDTTFADKKEWDLGERSQGQLCSICGAWRGAYGLEPTLELYVKHTVEVLRAIGRVLRKDGVVFWDIGDTYNSHIGDVRKMGGFQGKAARERPDYAQAVFTGHKRHDWFLKDKDLCLMPFRVVIAAQEDGWWVRSVIVWDKPNPMPESTKDRPTRSHEYILMLTKSAKYYWDADAVRTPYSPATIQRVEYDWGMDTQNKSQQYVDEGYYGRSAGEMNKELAQKIRGLKTKGDVEIGGQEQHHCQDIDYHPLGANIRSVWEFPTEPSGLEMCLSCGKIYESAAYRRLPEKIKAKNPSPDTEARDRPLAPPQHPYRGEDWGEQAIEGRDRQIKVKICRCGASNWLSHFATYPEKLPEICIKAATPEVGCCSRCGAPYERVTKPTKEYAKLLGRDWNIPERDEAEGKIKGHQRKHDAPSVTAQYETIGWRPTCNCNAGTEPSVVLDPFAGTGTTGRVAKKLGRKSILIDISENYCKLMQVGFEKIPLPLIPQAGEVIEEAPDWF